MKIKEFKYNNLKSKNKYLLNIILKTILNTFWRQKYCAIKKSTIKGERKVV